MAALRSFRHSGPSFADLVPYAGLVANGIVLLKDGSLMAGWYFAGPDSESSTDAERNEVSRQINTILARLGSGWMIQVEAVRVPTTDYPARQDCHFPDPVTRAIDNERRARFEQDWYTAQAAEAQRQQQLASYQREYRARADARSAEVRRHNAGVTELTEAARRREPEAVVEYFSAALYASTAWPEGFPRQFAAAYDPAAGQLVLDWELPAYDVVPEASPARTGKRRRAAAAINAPNRNAVRLMTASL